jgi:hypothetical protein
MSSTTYSPTAEQQEALRLFATGESLVIEAGAGAGKTSELRMIAESTTRRGQYIAFNKAIVEESKAKMPTTVACNTAHSLAYRAVVPGTRYADRLRNSARMKSTDIAKRLGIREIRLTLQDGSSKRLGPAYLAGVAMRGVTRFCQSADLEPDAQHVPYLDGIDLPPGARDNNRIVAKALVPAMRKAWADIIAQDGSLPFKHDHYLKIWHLSGPKINADFILFDEAQDANPVLVAIVEAQTHAQVVWVGDSQQAIYEFTGAVNALQKVAAPQKAFLSQSFRFGPAVAEVANHCLRLLDAELTLTGTDSIPSTVEQVDAPDVILCRTNATAVRHVLASIAAQRTVHLVGGGREVIEFAKAAQKLMEQGWTEHPELACFASWGEVQDYVEQDEQGGDLRLLVNLIDEFTAAVIIEALQNMPREADADLIVSTAHKSKGREWDTVQLADDFPAEPKDAELRLLYVAVTRARLTLDVTAAGEFFTGHTAPIEPHHIAPRTDAVISGDDTAGTPDHNLAALTADEHAQAHANGKVTHAQWFTILADGVDVGTITEASLAVDMGRAAYATGRYTQVRVVDEQSGELVTEFQA